MFFINSKQNCKIKTCKLPEVRSSKKEKREKKSKKEIRGEREEEERERVTMLKNDYQRER